ncbi:MAG: DUF5777 family beta-barrel protein [Bacteroidota bacterium]
MKNYLLILISFFSIPAFAQDDLLNMLENENPDKPSPVYATFKSTRVINLQSNETMKKKHLDFRIQHRFTPLDFTAGNNYGAYNLFGLDGAVLRLGFEYGITDKLMVGAGRSTIGKTYDFMLKYKILQQTTKGKRAMPFSLNYFGNMGINTLAWSDPKRSNLFTSRLSFVNQLIITKKFNDHVSLIVSPTLVHYNLVDSVKNPNDIFALGIGGSFKISRSSRFNIEYIPRLNGRDAFNGLYHDAFAIGFDIETGGHVFQLHFTNAGGLIEQQFVARTTDEFNGVSKLRFGFNLSRTFSMEKEGK